MRKGRGAKGKEICLERKERQEGNKKKKERERN